MDDPLSWFEGLYDRYYRNVLRYALQHADQAYAEDVVSETFLIAWRRSADVPDNPLPWLLVVARNLLRKHSDATRRTRLITDRIAAMTTQDDLMAWDTADHVISRSDALRALGALADADVEALTLVTWHGLTPAEAAVVAGISPRAFNVRLHRARKRLEAHLAADRAALEATPR